MRRITIEVNDDYGDVLSITASGRAGAILNVTVVAVDLHTTNKVKIDKKGKAWLTKESEE